MLYYQIADKLESLKRWLEKLGHARHLRLLLRQPLAKRLKYAQYSKCPCGALLAYDMADEVTRAWDCSDILLGKAIHKGQPGSKTHTDLLPFAFWSVK